MRIQLYKPLPHQCLVMCPDACKTAVGMTLFVQIDGGIPRYVMEEIEDPRLSAWALEAAKSRNFNQPDLIMGLEALALQLTA
ncbi:hypothetical protein SARC_05293 [Sphaeroforma arctica JP610]|uniref:Uncharacterized protein n=1 Tax=Sphaeroforma arctica JP610 TaxID=667725 RepID=A0A0L0FZY0_9EUKA|nr:hypothetical protein SARC_05293 [Sphaeroforma arctica JP610]KNC82422.1 hypothetical protein SARC_05293 [Sphaeroforma arctica JP610]|eukprot:XP_014156324.1 hypothetical protein SARC_05293 [Sphaeroforma arctica JP610]